MRRFAMRSVLIVAVASLAVVGVAAGARAQAPARADEHSQSTPKNFNYEIRDGKRVPKSNRVTNADGSWREETRVGNCTTVKEGSAAGEVKITRKCD
ncbi:MAG TPA: hypothetical protein VFK50_02115 [Sphingomicrobium sp.]|nr:hypothetical protein [Sphingomicrobium sp.]